MSHDDNFGGFHDDGDHSYDAQASFVQAQTAALQRYQRPPAEQGLCEDESAALAAALVASERDEEVRQKREEEAEADQRKRRRLLEEQQEQEQLARQLQREEELEADQELAQALEKSAEETQTRQTQQTLDESLSQVQQKKQKERHAGSWDCLQCTYENPPYAPTCIMCQVKAPMGTLIFENIPENMPFGVELELYITDGKRDGYTLEWMAQELTKLGPPTVEYRGYTHDTTHHCWKIVPDSSLRGSNHHDLCLELVSPVLQGNDGLNQLRVLMEHVRQLGIATNRTCGFHVHVDATNTPLSDLKRICQCFVALENAFDLLVAGNRSKKNRSADRNRYCRSNRIAFGRLSNKQRWDQIVSAHNQLQLVDLLNPEGDRYRKLNLTNLVNPNRPSTIEFRLHGGVEKLREAEAWVRLVLRFCNRAPTVDTRAIQTLPEEATPAMELMVLWEMVECPGLEQFYVLDRKLFVPHNYYAISGAANSVDDPLKPVGLYLSTQRRQGMDETISLHRQQSPNK